MPDLPSFTLVTFMFASSMALGSTELLNEPFGSGNWSELVALDFTEARLKYCKIDMSNKSEFNWHVAL